MKIPPNTTAAFILASALLTTASQAERIFGLEKIVGPFPTYTVTNTLFTFDSASPGLTTNVGVVTGLFAGQVLVGMDFRPATKELVAMSYNDDTNQGYLYKVNILSGALSQIGTGFTIPFAPGEVAGDDYESDSWGFDFNPVVDRIRAVNRSYDSIMDESINRSFRLDPNTGALVAEDTHIDNEGTSISGIAYSNNVPGATSTTLFAYNSYDDDFGIIGGLGGIPSPNLGQFFRIGEADFNNGFMSGLDISGVTGMGYAASSDGLYTFETSIAAATGEFTKVGSLLGRAVLDISVDPVVPIVYYQVTVNKPKGGSVSGVGSFAAGSTVTLKATPKKGYVFSGWFENGKRIGKKTKLKLDNLVANRSLSAKFVAE